MTTPVRSYDELCEDVVYFQSRFEEIRKEESVKLRDRITATFPETSNYQQIPNKTVQKMVEDAVAYYRQNASSDLFQHCNLDETINCVVKSVSGEFVASYPRAVLERIKQLKTSDQRIQTACQASKDFDEAVDYIHIPSKNIGNLNDRVATLLKPYVQDRVTAEYKEAHKSFQTKLYEVAVNWLLGSQSV